MATKKIEEEEGSALVSGMVTRIGTVRLKEDDQMVNAEQRNDMVRKLKLPQPPNSKHQIHTKNI